MSKAETKFDGRFAASLAASLLFWTSAFAAAFWLARSGIPLILLLFGFVLGPVMLYIAFSILYLPTAIMYLAAARYVLLAHELKSRTMMVVVLSAIVVIFVLVPALAGLSVPLRLVPADQGPTSLGIGAAR